MSLQERVLLPLLLLLAGCSSNRPRVEGNITFDGSPVDGGVIMFFAANSVNEPDKGHAEIRGGKYVVEAPEPGPDPGTYRVEIVWYKNLGKNRDPDLGSGRVQVIPKKYNQNSELKVDIKPGLNTFDYELKSK